MIGGGHEDCKRSRGYRVEHDGIPKDHHDALARAGAIHQHVWQYRGMTHEGLLVMVCDGHPEPVVRLVNATVEATR